jgi:hypothetical protein
MQPGINEGESVGRAELIGDDTDREWIKCVNEAISIDAFPGRTFHVGDFSGRGRLSQDGMNVLLGLQIHFSN